MIQPNDPSIFRERAEKARIEAPYWEGRLGTIHDLRICLINDDQHLLFAATYSDEFTPYVRDVIRFAAPWIDYIFTDVAVGYPGRGLNDQLPLATHQLSRDDLEAVQAEQRRPGRTTVLTHLGPPLAGRQTSASYARPQVPFGSPTAPSAAPHHAS